MRIARAHIAGNSVKLVCVNHPEPPQQFADALESQAKHLLDQVVHQTLCQWTINQHDMSHNKIQLTWLNNMLWYDMIDIIPCRYVCCCLVILFSCCIFYCMILFIYSNEAYWYYLTSGGLIRYGAADERPEECSLWSNESQKCDSWYPTCCLFEGCYHWLVFFNIILIFYLFRLFICVGVGLSNIFLFLCNCMH